jgi:urease gamma subunit
MYLTPTEEERLRVFAVAELAPRTLERGLGLNAPEAIAIACDEMHAAARAGMILGEVLEAGRSSVPPERLMPGVAELVSEIRLEVLLEEGSRLVVLREPWPRRDRAHPGPEPDLGHGHQHLRETRTGLLALPLPPREPPPRVRPCGGGGVPARRARGLLGPVVTGRDPEVVLVRYAGQAPA